MDFKQLECFVTAVDEGSFSNAADRLRLSQSMVTIHVRNLEKELGSRLLNRTTRSMELSADGRVFYDYAKRMLKLSQESMLALTSAKQIDQRINIAATLYTSRYYVSPWAVEFNRIYPDVEFNFINCLNAELHSRLSQDGYEFAVSDVKIMNGDYAVRSCGTTNLVLITSNEPRFRALQGGPSPLSLLGTEPIIARSGTSTMQQEFLRWIRANAPETRLKVAATVDDTETIKRLVSAGMGISIISVVAASDMVASGQLLSFPLAGAMPYHLYFVYKKKYLTPVQSAFRDFILEKMRAAGQADE